MIEDHDDIWKGEVLLLWFELSVRVRNSNGGTKKQLELSGDEREDSLNNDGTKKDRYQQSQNNN